VSGAYYNEFDPFAAAWLRELIKAGHIADGEVDERSIEDVRPSDLRGFTQHHFFAGIGVWSHALRNAGWADDRPIWTGSCPCQPFSAGGKKGGFADERHLWPAFHHLIRECRPSTVIGEQVASKDGLTWFDLVSTDLEGTGYTAGAVDTCAAGFGAPHIRQRLYWVAFPNKHFNKPALGRGAGIPPTATAAVGPNFAFAREPSRASADVFDGVAYAYDTRPQGRVSGWDGSRELLAGAGGLELQEQPSPTNGFWRDAGWLYCRDDKWRPVEPRTFPLAHGATNRVGRLRGYGNAIVAPQAQAFIGAVMESL
jgi:DNA (cytosine-5)-methyltransferase 1